MATRRTTRGRAGAGAPSDGQGGAGHGANGHGATGSGGARELIVIARGDAGLRATPQGVTARSPRAAEPLAALLAREGVALKPLFGTSEERIRRRMRPAAAGEAPVPDLGVYYHVDAPDERLDELCAELAAQETIEACYVKPAGEPPVVPPGTVTARPRRPEPPADELEGINDMQPSAAEPPASTPDFTPRQLYLGPAPAGIDAQHAWTIAGGRGDGIRILDLEWGWRFGHEDLLANQLGIVGGTGSTQDDHGTAVLGEISGDVNGFGVTGIAPNARVGAVAFSMPSATAIRLAADKLSSGDILLLEIHRPGPNATGNGQEGFIAIEWWPDDYAAIRYAVAKGVIVVEAAGNGGEDFDAAVYSQRPTGFPSSWRNPFDPQNASSGAVIVGAGAPPPGTHGRNHGPDRSRLGFSNWGRRVDCQGWGREVTTTGYGDLQGGNNKDEWYTDRFSGTSSASPIVVGALACVQGARKAAGQALLDSSGAIALVRASGSPQTDAPGRPATQRIGHRPDLRQMMPQSASSAWLQNRTVSETFASTHADNAWAHVVGLGWRRIAPSSTDGVSNLLTALCDAVARQRKVHLRIEADRITQLYVL